MSVLIVGAGPSGLALALWLTKLKPDVKLRIVSKAKGPGTTSRAIVVHARPLEFYRQLGIIEDVLAHGSVVDGIGMYIDGQSRGQLRFGHIGGDTTPYPFILALQQDKHERILVEHLKKLGVEVEFDTELIHLSQSNDKVLVSLSSGGPVAYDYVAGCDGSHSTVRGLIDVAMQGAKYPSRFYVVDAVTQAEEPLTTVRMCLGERVMAVNIPVTKPSADGQVVRCLGAVPPGFQRSSRFQDFSDRVTELTGLQFDKIN